eukprot:SM000357S13386  [mRNA]  locus=s357:82231:85191:- [translate_table: standard]
MKFGQQLAAYRADSSPPKLPVLDFKLLKKMLAQCPGNILDADVVVPDEDRDPGSQSRDATTSRPTCSKMYPLYTLSSCGVFSACDASFFQELTQQIIIVLSSFNKRARKLLRLHQSKGLRRHYYMLKLKFIWSYASLCEAGKHLETYIQMNSTAVRKILKKYKKDLLFDPISLNCGHVFCNGCACLAAGVTTFQGALAAPAGSKCPLCRQSGVYCAVLRMTELHMMIKSRQPVEWEQRYDQERAAFLRQAREYWSRQVQGMLGYI